MAKKNNWTKDVKRWQLTVTASLVSLIMLYVLLHILVPGAQYRKLSVEEVNTVNAIYYTNVKPQQTSTPVETEIDTPLISPPSVTDNVADSTKTKRISKYIIAQYCPCTGRIDNSDSYCCSSACSDSMVTAIINDYGLETFIKVLPDLKFCGQSYFWLYPFGIIVELIFWSMFGLLCSLLYYVSTTIAAGEEFKPKYVSDHWAKAFYTPITTVIIYLSLYVPFFSFEAADMLEGYGIIIMGFIMGFFSGRTMKLLGGIKELFFGGFKTPDNNEDEDETEISDFEKGLTAIIEMLGNEDGIVSIKAGNEEGVIDITVNSNISKTQQQEWRNQILTAHPNAVNQVNFIVNPNGTDPNTNNDQTQNDEE